MNADSILLREDADGVATLTLNRPAQFNALSEALLEALQRALNDVADDPAVRVVVLAAAGKAFCAGHDLKEMRAHESQDYFRALFSQCARLMLTLQNLPQPVIAKVQGVATAAGCQLVAACDLAVAGQTARFAVSGIKVGLFCATPAVALSRNLGRKAALEMLLTGDFIGAAEAQQRGLINRVVALDQLDAEVKALTDSLCAKSVSAIRLGKKMFYRQLEMGVAAAYQLAAETMACNMMNADAQDGIDRFMNKG